MGTLTPINLPTASNRGRHDLEASARLINCYMERIGDGGKHQFALYAVNGLTNYSTLTGASGGVEAMLALPSELITVAGRQIYRTTPAAATSIVAGLASDGLVTMAYNRQSPNPQVMIVRDGQWGIYQNGAFTLGSDPDIPAPIFVTFHKGKFVVLGASGQFNWSGTDAETFDGLDFANAESSADGGVALSTRGEELIVFGENSMEFWDDIGADGYSRNATRQYGCYTAGSVSEITALVGGQMVDSVVWAATDQKGKFAGLYLLNGYTGQKISTYEIDRIIEADSTPSAIRSFAWSENGHSFYTITGSSYSWTYDTVEGVWHERQTAGQSYWQVSAHATFGNKTIFGSSTAGTLYQSSLTAYDAAGADVIMEVRLPITHMWPYSFTLNTVELDAVTGVGINSTDSHLSDPQVMLDLSTDGGRNFGTVRSRTLGADAQIMAPIRWRGFGRIGKTGAVLRFRISAGVRRCLMGVAVDADKLAA